MKFFKTDLALALAGITLTRDTSQTKPLPDFNKDKLVRNYIVDDFTVDMEK